MLPSSNRPVNVTLPSEIAALLRRGTVIPAHPLALDARRQLDVRRQRALARYYLDAGSGGLAVGVHATQFAIREVGLYEPVLKIAAEDRKSTRLNSSHSQISYAVFCLKKKKKVNRSNTND